MSSVTLARSDFEKARKRLRVLGHAQLCHGMWPSPGIGGTGFQPVRRPWCAATITTSWW
jgi:hypothetical protein